MLISRGDLDGAPAPRRAGDSGSGRSQRRGDAAHPDGEIHEQEDDEDRHHVHQRGELGRACAGGEPAAEAARCRSFMAAARARDGRGWCRRPGRLGEPGRAAAVEAGARCRRSGRGRPPPRGRVRVRRRWRARPQAGGVGSVRPRRPARRRGMARRRDGVARHRRPPSSTVVGASAPGLRASAAGNVKVWTARWEKTAMLTRKGIRIVNMFSTGMTSMSSPGHAASAPARRRMEVGCSWSAGTGARQRPRGRPRRARLACDSGASQGS